MTLIIPMENFRTLLWRLLNQGSKNAPLPLLKPQNGTFSTNPSKSVLNRFEPSTPRTFNHYKTYINMEIKLH